MKSLENILTGIAAAFGVSAIWKRADAHGPGCGLSDRCTYHRNAFCSAVKEERGRLRRCILNDDFELAAEAEKGGGEAFFHHCHAGVTELVVPLFAEGRCREVMLFGIFREGGEGCPYPELAEAFGALPRKAPAAWEPLAAVMKELAGILRERRDALHLDTMTKSIRDPRISQAVGSLNRRLGERIPVAELAREVYLSESRFMHLFKQETGLTFTEYLKGERVREAKRLLSESDLPILEVALAAGFHDQSHLGRILREVLNTTPLAYRRRFGRKRDS